VKVRDGLDATSRLLLIECRRDALRFQVLNSSSNTLSLRYEHVLRLVASKGFQADYVTSDEPVVKEVT